MKLKIVFCISCTLFLFACKAKRGEGEIKLKNRSSEYIQKQMVQNQVKADWFSGKAKIKYNDGKQSLSVFSSIRIKKDSLIWLNAKVFGIEAARVLIEPDSVHVLDRMGKRYIARDIWWLQDEFGLPVNFNGLQALLLGNPVFFQSDFESEKDSVNYSLSGSNEKYTTEYSVNGQTFKLDKMLLSKPKEKQVAHFDFSNYMSLSDNQLFSFSRNINLNSPDVGNIVVKIDFSSVDISTEVSMPFSVSEQYRRE